MGNNDDINGSIQDESNETAELHNKDDKSVLVDMCSVSVPTGNVDEGATVSTG